LTGVRMVRFRSSSGEAKFVMPANAGIQVRFRFKTA
jgi:hypothetical protein